MAELSASSLTVNVGALSNALATSIQAATSSRSEQSGTAGFSHSITQSQASSSRFVVAINTTFLSFK